MGDEFVACVGALSSAQVMEPRSQAQECIAICRSVALTPRWLSRSNKLIGARGKKVVATSTRWKYSDKDIEVALEHSDCNGLHWGRWAPCSSCCLDKLTSWHVARVRNGTRSRAAGTQATSQIRHSGWAWLKPTCLHESRGESSPLAGYTERESDRRGKSENRFCRGEA